MERRQPMAAEDWIPLLQPGESLRWNGTSTTRNFVRAMLNVFLFSLLCATVLGYQSWYSSPAGFCGKEDGHCLTVFPIFGLAAIVGLLVALLAVVESALHAKGSRLNDFAITDRRAILMVRGAFLRGAVILRDELLRPAEQRFACVSFGDRKYGLKFAGLKPCDRQFVIDLTREILRQAK